MGRKTAERLVLELRSQITPFLLPEHAQAEHGAEKPDGLQEDVLSALVNLGYPRSGAEKALSAAIRSGECGRTFEDLLRHTLRRLSG